MELQLLAVERLQEFLLCLARVGALLGALPVFGGGQTPARLLAGLAVLLTLAVFPVLEPFLPRQQLQPAGLALLVGQEALFGIMVGLVARLIFTAVEFGGTVVGYQMGFAAANVFDPQNQRQISLISQFQNIFAMMLFLALDMHHLFLRALVHSYRLLPPGEFDFAAGVPYLMQLTGAMFVLGIKFSAPILAVLLLSGFVLGIMARVFPQMNVFLLSFPINIGVAFLVIGLTLNMVVVLLSREFDALGERFMTLFELL